MDQRPASAETLAAQGLGEADPVSGALAPVINLSTNYEQQPDGSYPQGRVYTRADNPTCEHAERLLAALEGGGCACALFASGMAAATAVFQSLLPGDHVLVSRVLYWGAQVAGRVRAHLGPGRGVHRHQRSWRRDRREPDPLENRIRVVTCGSSGCQAAREYSLIRPPRTRFRWIRSRSRSATVRRPPSCSPLGMRWAMPWCGRAVL